MMKTFLKKLLLLVTLTITVSCGNDDDSGLSFTEENYMTGYLAITGSDEEEASIVDYSDYEFGLEFSPIVTGKITALSVKLPAANPSLRITLWDTETTSVIRTQMVNVATEGTSYTFEIDDLQLVKDKEYAITMNTNDWYNRERTDGTAVAYPLIVGNIQINSYIWDHGTDQIYPTIGSLGYYAGDISFNFIQTE